MDKGDADMTMLATLLRRTSSPTLTDTDELSQTAEAKTSVLVTLAQLHTASASEYLPRIEKLNVEPGYQQQLLIERLHTKSLLQNLTMIKIRIAPLQQDAPAPARAPLVYRPSIDTLKLLQQVATDIDDPGLRAALQRLGRQQKP